MEAYFLKQQEIAYSVSKIRAHYGTHGGPWAGDVVFMAQTERDRTLIGPDGFCDNNSVLCWVQERLKGRALWIKPHPLSMNNPLISDLQKTCGGRIIEMNTYALLASATPFEVATISSSVAREAEFFDHKVSVFNASILDWINSGPICLHGYRDSCFWWKLLSPVMQVAGIPRTPDLAFMPNRLREQLGYYSLDRNIW